MNCAIIGSTKIAEVHAEQLIKNWKIKISAMFFIISFKYKNLLDTIFIMLKLQVKYNNGKDH